MHDMEISSQAIPFSSFEGISDVSDLTTNLVNTIAAIVRNRADSFINGNDLYGFDAKFNKLVNRIFGLMPMPLNLGDTGLYIDGFWYDNIWAQNKLMTAKLKTQLRYEGAVFNSTNCTDKMYARYIDNSFDLQMAVNDCAFNELVFTLYSAGLLHLPIRGGPINTSYLALLVGTDLIREFGAGQPCEILISPTELPQFAKNSTTFDYSESNFFILDTQIAMDIKCQNYTEDSNGLDDTDDVEIEYTQAATLIMDLNTHFHMNMTYNVNLGFQIYDLELKYIED